MEISAIPTHTHSQSHSQSLSLSPCPFPLNVDNWNQWKRASTTISQIDTTADCWQRTGRDSSSLGRQVSRELESFIFSLSLSLSFYFNFYFNWNNIIPRSSHELSPNTHSDNDNTRAVLMEFVCFSLGSTWGLGFHLGLVSSDCRSLPLAPNRTEGIVNYPIVYCVAKEKRIENN